MPVLKDFRRTKIINLKQYQDSEIEIYDSVLAKDSVINFDSNNITEILSVLPKFIKSWNFTDDNGVLLEINPENIGLLNVESLTEIALAIKDFSFEVKKKD